MNYGESSGAPKKLSADSGGGGATSVSASPSSKASEAFTAPKIELPSGGGAIRGIGEKFSFNASTGSGSLSVPLPVQPGRGGFGPQLALSYDSGLGNGVFGAGWQLGVPSISRKTDKGLPRYDDHEATDTFIFAGAEDLVPDARRPAQVRDGFTVRSFGPRVEGGFARIEWWLDFDNPTHNHWRVISRDNITHILGLTPEARIAAPDDPSRVFQWLLQASFDDKGSAFVHTWRPEDFKNVGAEEYEHHRIEGAARIANVHLESVLHGNKTPFFAGTGADYLRSLRELVDSGKDFKSHWLFRVFFDYSRGEKTDLTLDNTAWLSRADPFSSYRAGFEQRTWRLCRRVMFESNISIPVNGVETGYVGVTHGLFFEYEESPVLTKLKSVGQTHFRDGGSADMPPVDFEYSVSKEMHFAKVPHGDAPGLPEGVDGVRHEWVDLDGEGISGVLSRRNGVWCYAPNRWAALEETDATPPNTPLIGGVFQTQRPLLLQPAATALQLADLEGDGSLDAVEYADGVVRFHSRDEDRGWTPSRVMRLGPAWSVSDPNSRFIDLDGDGKADLLMTEDDCLVWQGSLGAEGFGAVHRIAKMLDEKHGPRCVFAEEAQTIFLADMSGDGLTDIVRIRSGDVCYWPNMGRGKFGARVRMAHSPTFAPPNLFDPGRLRLIDVDGSGVPDLIYLGHNGTKFWSNHSGNSWGDAKDIPFAVPNQFANVSSVDFYGRGTGCLVWSSSAPGDEGAHFGVVDLTGGVKPHLMIATRNNLGAETRLKFTSSTQFYLRDLAKGRPWITRLPFPVNVVESVETIDHISGNHFISRYAYHHGYYDKVEREFRGFSMVEQWDTEQIKAVNGDVIASTNWDAASYVPPVHTKTWFHTGAWRPKESLVAAMKREFWQGDQLGIDLADTIIPDGLSVAEEREVCRALRGRMIRQETFADDESPKAALPYSVIEQNFTVSILQRGEGNRHAVVFAQERETLSAHYERHADDPRITHQMVLKVDAFGNVEQSVAIAYGRRGRARFTTGDSAEQERWHLCQRTTLLTLTEAAFTQEIDKPDAKRTPLPADASTFELTGSGWGDATAPLDFETMRQELSVALPSTRRKRLLSRAVTMYRSDDLTRLLPPGELESLALPGESYQLTLDPVMLGLLTDKISVANSTALLLDTASGYRDLEGNGNLWIPSGRVFFSPNETDSSPVELALARQSFFMPRRFANIFGHSTKVEYDAPLLFPVTVTDAAKNQTRAEHDYRVLQPRQLQDANENIATAAFDLRGLVVATAIAGDTLTGFVPPDDAATLGFINAADPRSLAPALLGKATTLFLYDVFAFKRERSPAIAIGIVRETHERDLAGAPHSRTQVSFSYSDGLGREMQKKVQAEKGPLVPGGPEVTRWVGSGWTIFNNKGKPVRQFEPFFSPSHRFESDHKAGVSPFLFYDPAQRVVATLHPNHTWEKVVFDPWCQTAWDVSDTVLTPPEADADVAEFFKRLPDAEHQPTWHQMRSAPSATPDDHDAAQAAALHAATPTMTHLDTLGRPFLVITHNHWIDAASGAAVDEFATTRTVLDIEGRQLAVRDAKHRTVMAWDYDFLGRPLRQHGMDGGRRWMLADAASQPLRRWDERQHEFRHEYQDPLHRPTRHLLSRAGAAAICYEAFTYGEAAPNAVAANLRGRLWQHRDTAGLIIAGPYDDKGNLLKASRQLCADFKTTPDWNVTPALEADVFTTRTRCDALNRPVESTAPDGSITKPDYNEAGLIEAVNAVADGGTFKVVTDISYNAKGQRLSVTHGNGVRSTFEYEKETSRLLRIFTARHHEGADSLQDLRYIYEAAGNITSLRDQAQPTHYFDGQMVEPHATYTYDALYRLIAATGREHIGQNLPANAWDSHRSGEFDSACKFVPFPLRSARDSQAMRRYTQRYEYDAVGNFQVLHHIANGGSYTRSYQYDPRSLIPHEEALGNNRLVSTKIGSTTEHYAHDIHGSMTEIPHLPVMKIDFRDQLCESRRQAIICAPDRPASDGEITYYVYDTGGERVRKVTEHNGKPIHERIYIGGWETYHAYVASSGALKLQRDTLHVQDGQKRIALIETRVLDTAVDDQAPQQIARLQLSNHLGTATVEIELNPEGVPTASRVISYEETHPYGTTAYKAVSATLRTASKRYKYTGKERDEETGFSYHSARYYLPWLGRWGSCDCEVKSNLMCYGKCNPLTFLDHNGCSESATANRLWGGLRAVGGATQTFVGAVVFIQVEVPFAAQAVGAVAVAHGLSDLEAGWRQVVTGKSEKSAVEYLAQSGAEGLGVPEPAAKAFATGVDMGLGFVSPLPVSGGPGAAFAMSRGGEVAIAGVHMEQAVAVAQQARTVQVSTNATTTVMKVADESNSDPATNSSSSPSKSSSAGQGSPDLPDEYFDEAMSRIDGDELRASGAHLDDLTNHAQSSAARAERGVSGQSAHISARSAMRDLAGYDPRSALTRLLDVATHRGFDDYWKAIFQKMAASNKSSTISVGEYFNVMRDAIGHNPHFTNGEANSMVELLRDELFVQHGLKESDLLRLPYSK